MTVSDSDSGDGRWTSDCSSAAPQHAGHTVAKVTQCYTG